MEQIIELCKAYYKQNTTGGNLHIILDDGNVEQDNLDFCKKEAEKNGDTAGLEILKELQHMTELERLCLTEHRYDEYSQL